MGVGTLVADAAGRWGCPGCPAAAVLRLLLLRPRFQSWRNEGRVRYSWPYRRFFCLIIMQLVPSSLHLMQGSLVMTSHRIFRARHAWQAAEARLRSTDRPDLSAAEDIVLYSWGFSRVVVL